ncbi:MAG: hypothetical protein LBR58_02465 [Propionibacteriaceae bacterium]|nr:hypothetical protein [Propionibacteriaceae bacterium]
MTLILTALAALIVTVLRFARPQFAKYRLGVLALMLWGAALMWCVDGFAALAEGEAFVELADLAAVADDALLGLAVLALALAAWGVTVLLGRRQAAAHA